MWAKAGKLCMKWIWSLDKIFLELPPKSTLATCCADLRGILPDLDATGVGVACYQNNH